MARILLGVSGGIAAYKALHFIRLATEAGHVVRVIQTPTSLRFVGKASFTAITGAPVLVDEFEHDPARGAFPGQEPPSHQPQKRRFQLPRPQHDLPPRRTKRPPPAGRISVLGGRDAAPFQLCSGVALKS